MSGDKRSTVYFRAWGQCPLVVLNSKVHVYQCPALSSDELGPNQTGLGKGMAVVSDNPPSLVFQSPSQFSEFLNDLSEPFCLS